jgi:hypothetical protein
MRKLAAIALMLLLGEIAGAQVPTSGNVFFGYAYYNTNLDGRPNQPEWMGGVHGREGLAFHRSGRDVSGHYGSESSANCTAARLGLKGVQWKLFAIQFPGRPPGVGIGRQRAAVLPSHWSAQPMGTSQPRVRLSRARSEVDSITDSSVCWAGAFSWTTSTRIGSSFHKDNLRFSTGIVLRF